MVRAGESETLVNRSSLLPIVSSEMKEKIFEELLC